MYVTIFLGMPAALACCMAGSFPFCSSLLFCYNNNCNNIIIISLLGDWRKEGGRKAVVGGRAGTWGNRRGWAACRRQAWARLRLALLACLPFWPLPCLCLFGSWASVSSLFIISYISISYISEEEKTGSGMPCLLSHLLSWDLWPGSHLDSQAFIVCVAARPRRTFMFWWCVRPVGDVLCGMLFPSLNTVVLGHCTNSTKFHSLIHCWVVGWSMLSSASAKQTGTTEKDQFYWACSPGMCVSLYSPFYWHVMNMCYF